MSGASKRSPSSLAGVSDVADWGDKDLAGAYPPGTKFDLGGGQVVDVTAVPDVIGGVAKKPAAKKPAAKKPVPRAPERPK